MTGPDPVVAAAATPDNDMICPMPTCREALLLEFVVTHPLTYGDLRPNLATVTHADSPTCGTWRIECLNGHRILFPDTMGCPCEPDDQGGEDCPHDPADYEWSEEGPHAFHNFDRARLLALLRRLHDPVTEGDA